MKKAIFAVGVVILSGCGGSGGGSDGNTASSVQASVDTTITQIGIVGSEQAGEEVSINPGINSGEFTVSWDIQSSDPYHVKVYVSEDVALSDEDILFFSQNCGSSSQLYQCNSHGEFSCQFDTENNISCDEVNAANPGRNLDILLDTLPKQAHIIIRACNGLLDSCADTSVEITFQ
jgi:hypothetical protein